MEQDRQLSELLLQQRTVQAQLTDATRRWATLVVCRHLLDKARGVYERERQPLVIKEADRFLNTMAHGRYRILAAVGEDGVHLEDRSLARKDEVTWSAGLADQVYLAIRLGLAREFGRHSEPLPVILDDVLGEIRPQPSGERRPGHPGFRPGTTGAALFLPPGIHRNHRDGTPRPALSGTPGGHLCHYRREDQSGFRRSFRCSDVAVIA